MSPRDTTPSTTPAKTIVLEAELSFDAEPPTEADFVRVLTEYGLTPEQYLAQAFWDKLQDDVRRLDRDG